MPATQKKLSADSAADILREIGIASIDKDKDARGIVKQSAAELTDEIESKTCDTVRAIDMTAVSQAQEDPSISSTAKENIQNTGSAADKLGQTSDFRIESAEELLQMIEAEVGLDSTCAELSQKENEKAKQKDDLYSTALFDKLYDEMDLDDNPDGILNIKNNNTEG